MAYMNDPPLTGRTVAVPEARELQVVAALRERRRARVLRWPLVGPVVAEALRRRGIEPQLMPE